MVHSPKLASVLCPAAVTIGARVEGMTPTSWFQDTSSTYKGTEGRARTGVTGTPHAHGHRANQQCRARTRRCFRAPKELGMEPPKVLWSTSSSLHDAHPDG